MITATLPAQDVAGLVGDWDHGYCCNPDRAWCGADLSGHEDIACLYSDDPGVCPACVVLRREAYRSSAGCGGSACPVRGRLS